MSARSAVLFLVFNRPDTTSQVFEAIRRARPAKLYIAADGPRENRAGEAERCAAVRRIATAVDWTCETYTLLRERNLGCKIAVSSAISWFFEHEAEGIVLEDDCVPDPSFFLYCDELLARYRSDERVMCISGDNFISRVWSPQESYYFSRYAHIWGWATWRRAWQNYDVALKEWPSSDKRALLEQWLPGAPHDRAYWREMFDRVAGGRVDTWDYQWIYACLKQHAVSCVPKVNLISNIGFGPGATHTHSPDSKHANLSVGSLPLPLVHPGEVSANVAADRWTSQHVFGVDARLVSVARWRRRLLHLASKAWHRVTVGT
jgi:hypothetical protein